MTQTLERPRVETTERPPVLPEYHEPVLVRWLPWLLLVLVMSAGFVALWMAQVEDTSHDRAEEIRFELLDTHRYPIDNSMFRIERIRFDGLQPNIG